MVTLFLEPPAYAKPTRHLRAQGAGHTAWDHSAPSVKLFLEPSAYTKSMDLGIHGSGIHGSIDPWMRSMYPWICGSMDPWIWGSMDTWIHGSMDPGIHGSMDPWIWGSMDPWIHDPWIHGSMDPWIHGSVDLWILDPLIHGSMDPWMLVYLSDACQTTPSSCQMLVRPRPPEVHYQPGAVV